MSERPASHIVFDSVEVKYSEYVYALRGVSLQVSRGDFVFFVGKTGSGKSTLLKLLSKEVRPTSGRVLLWDVDLADIEEKEIPLLRRTMGIVPQDFGLLPRKKVWENVAYAMRAVGAGKKEIRRRVPEILEMVKIGHRADAYPHQLSGGEQQRVAIGRALINSPKLLIADEPTGNLDPEHSWTIMEILLDLNKRGTTVLVASHDMLILERVGKRTITLVGGHVASDETPTALPFLETEGPILVSEPEPELFEAEEPPPEKDLLFEELADEEPEPSVAQDAEPETDKDAAEPEEETNA